MKKIITIIKILISLPLILFGITGIFMIIDDPSFINIFMTLFFILPAFFLVKSAYKFFKPSKTSSNENVNNKQTTDILETKVKSPSKSKVAQFKYNYEFTSDELKYKKSNSLKPDFVALDFETTGLSHTNDRIIQIGAARFRGFQVVDTYKTLVNPEMRIPPMATKVNGISNEMVKNKPKIYAVLPELMEFLSDDVIVAHNAPFDMKFLLHNIEIYNNNYPETQIEFNSSVIDSLSQARKFIDTHNHKLETLKNHLNLDDLGSHDAEDDAIVAGYVCRECYKIDETNTLFDRLVNQNLAGQKLEKQGKIEEAIALYEDNISNNFDGTFPYDRLAILYRKLKRKDDEIRVLNHAIYVFENIIDKGVHGNDKKIEKFKERLNKLIS